ncbi:Hypothetical protein HPV225_0012 [Helicobacter pylori v225d]|nr:Hypothetical protein HPV225_0012 [Helicobacter pylori v225d]
MSRIIEKYCGFHRNDTLLKRHDSFCLNKNLVALNNIRITTDAMRFCCWLVLFLGFKKSFVFIKI